jgi:hypothetical protein
MAAQPHASQQTDSAQTQRCCNRVRRVYRTGLKRGAARSRIIDEFQSVAAASPQRVLERPDLTPAAPGESSMDGRPVGAQREHAAFDVSGRSCRVV